MKSHASICLSCILAGMLVSMATDALAQHRRGLGGPSSQAARVPSDRPIVTNAPYPGVAVTTIVQILGDGTRIKEKTEAKFYRDRAGRIRREQTILGVVALNPSMQLPRVVTIDPTPEGAFAYTLDPIARTARRGPRASGVIPVELAGAIFALRTGRMSLINQVLLIPQVGTGASGRQADEALGTHQIEGVRATGRRTTNTIPAGQIGNDRPIEITDERWESPKLKVLVYSRFSDPRTGVVEYRLTQISRAEPASELFAVPTDYTILESEAGVIRGRVGNVGVRRHM